MAGTARITRRGLDVVVVSDFEDAGDRARSEYFSRAWDHVTKRAREEAAHVEQFEPAVFDAIRNARISRTFFLFGSKDILNEGELLEGIISCTPLRIAEAYPGAKDSDTELSSDRYPLRVEVDVEFRLAVSGISMRSIFAEPQIAISQPGDFPFRPLEISKHEARVTRRIRVFASVSAARATERRYTDFRVEGVGTY